MYKLLSINDVPIKDPEGSFIISREDKYNEYEGENGHKTIEIIRSNVINISVSYKGLTAKQLKNIVSLLNIVTTFTLFDPATEEQKEITGLVDNMKTSKVYYKNGVSVWSLSFEIKEL